MEKKKEETTVTEVAEAPETKKRGRKPAAAAVTTAKTSKKSFADVYAELSAIDVRDHLEEKMTPDGKPLRYLSWVWAVDIVTRFDPDWTYRIVEFDTNGLEVTEGHGYQFQRTLSGYLVWTEVTICGHTKRMWLPIMDSCNYAMHREGYRAGSHFVPPADAMALNKTIMRCLVKTIALFGLGLKVFAGEDLPAPDTPEKEVPEQANPEQARPEQAQPANAQPAPVKPVEQAQPEQVQPDQPQPVQTKPEQVKPVVQEAEPVAPAVPEEEDILDQYGISDPDDDPVQEEQEVAFDIEAENPFEEAMRAMDEAEGIPVPPKQDNKLAAALDFKIRIDRKGLTGRPMRDLVEQSKSRAKSMKVLTSLAEMDTSHPEARAARLIIDAIKSGTVSFPVEAEQADAAETPQYVVDDLINVL